MQQEDVSILERLELLEPLIKYRRLVLERSWSNWNFKMYFGPSFENSDEECPILDYTMFGYTHSLDSGITPSMPSDLSGIMIKFDNKAFAKWTKSTKPTLLETVENSFNTKDIFTGDLE